MKKSGAAVLIMLLLLTGCGDTLDEKHIEERQTEKTSQTEEQEQIPTGNTEVQLENSVEKYSAETEQQRYALNLPEAYRSKIDEIDVIYIDGWKKVGFGRMMNPLHRRNILL